MVESHLERSFETVGELAELYLGNILYSLELSAVTLEQQGRVDDSAFYRGIARKLANAHGAAKKRAVTGGQTIAGQE